MRNYIGILILVFISACSSEKTHFEATIRELSDAEYPANPNIGFRHSQAKASLFKSIEINTLNNDRFDLVIQPKVAGKNEISIKDIPLLEWMPTIPAYIKNDSYLASIGVINQEWNRQQVAFNAKQFSISGKNTAQISRVDIARNCLNAYLWEVLVYAKEADGQEKIYWQGWFDFPHELYAQLFEKRNQIPFSVFQKSLENWIDPPSEKINLLVLRTINSEQNTSFQAFNDEMYPVKSEREKKKRNIIVPKAFKTMDDLLSDSTRFATFSPPGYYNEKDPRVTNLSRLGKLTKVIKRNITTALKLPALELEYVFVSNKDGKTITRLIIGGIDTSLIPILPTEKANDGWQTSMGIANHSFNETFDYQQAHLTKNNGFYAFLLDENENWLDSHKVGIDGPMLHFDAKGSLHLWILAFERHAFVGHYSTFF